MNMVKSDLSSKMSYGHTLNAIVSEFDWDIVESGEQTEL